jgi:hypothetical protein
MRYAILLAMLISGCYVPPRLPPDLELPVKAVEYAFRKLGYEPGNALAGFHIYWARSNGEYRALCPHEHPSTSSACASQKVTHGGRGYPRAVIAPGQPAYNENGCSVISHEAIHWVILHLGLAPHSLWDMGDHADKRFFNPYVPGSAEQIACEWLKEQRSGAGS